jgi:hypothetical protein
MTQELKDILAGLDVQVSRLEARIAELKAIEVEVLAGLQALEGKLKGVQ